MELPLRALFEGPTVAELAGRVEEMRRAGLPVLPPVVPVERTGPLPLSFAQERLWFIDRLEPESATYNIPAALRLAGALDEAALERALGEIVRRHEALRTVFARGGRLAGAGDRALRRVRPAGGGPVGVGRGGSRGGGQAPGRRRRRGGRSTSRRGRSSARRCCGWAPRSTCCCSRCTTSSATGGAWGCSSGSCRRCTRRTARAGSRRCRSCRCSTPTTRVWQREQLAGEALDRQLAYWREQLAGAPELLELPTDHPRPAVQTYRGASVPVELPRSCWSGCRRWGGSEGATLYMTLLARLPGAAGQVRRQRGRGGGQPDRRADARGGGGADRLLRQHPGAAHRPLGRPSLPRDAAAGAGGDAGRVRAPGGALREAGGRAAAGAQPEPLAALPGDVHAAERRGRGEALFRGWRWAESARSSRAPSSISPWRSRRPPRACAAD